MSGAKEDRRGEERGGRWRWDGDNIRQLHLCYAGVTWSPTHSGELGCLHISHGSIPGRPDGKWFQILLNCIRNSNDVTSAV